ncbi:MAG: DHH family phosphoesterase [Phycisphaerales bacterium]|nr:DHH family phosphoesterase [Phycisphaerales bacterium]
MFKYESNTDLANIAALVADAGRIVVTTHAKPDGDAIGSAMSIRRALGDRVDVLLMGPVPSAIRLIAGSTPWIDASQQMPESGEDLVLVVDTGAYSQVEQVAPWLRERQDRIIVLDHHASGDDMGGLRWVDTKAASCTLVMMDLLDTMGLPITGGPESVAEALFCGLATDTGWFRFSNADSRAFAAASRLLEIGVDRDGLYRTIEETARPTRLALQARAMQSLELLHDDRCALMSLHPRDFKETGGNQGELAGTVNIPMEIASVECSVLLCSEGDAETKISFRSKPPKRAGGPFVDASALARQLGGGGHVHAAGARVAGPIDVARDRILEVTSELGATE